MLPNESNSPFVDPSYRQLVRAIEVKGGHGPVAASAAAFRCRVATLAGEAPGIPRAGVWLEPGTPPGSGISPSRSWRVRQLYGGAGNCWHGRRTGVDHEPLPGGRHAG